MLKINVIHLLFETDSFHLFVTGKQYTCICTAPDLIDFNIIIFCQEVLQADIKLNAYHCDKGFSNLLCTKACKPIEAAAGDAMHDEDKQV